MIGLAVQRSVASALADTYHTPEMENIWERSHSQQAWMHPWSEHTGNHGRRRISFPASLFAWTAVAHTVHTHIHICAQQEEDLTNVHRTLTKGSPTHTQSPNRGFAYTHCHTKQYSTLPHGMPAMHFKCLLPITLHCVYIHALVHPCMHVTEVCTHTYV